MFMYWSAFAFCISLYVLLYVSKRDNEIIHILPSLFYQKKQCIFNIKLSNIRSKKTKKTKTIY